MVFTLKCFVKTPSYVMSVGLLATFVFRGKHCTVHQNPTQNSNLSEHVCWIGNCMEQTLMKHIRKMFIPGPVLSYIWMCFSYCGGSGSRHAELSTVVANRRYRYVFRQIYLDIPTNIVQFCICMFLAGV